MKKISAKEEMGAQILRGLSVNKNKKSYHSRKKSTADMNNFTCSVLSRTTANLDIETEDRESFIYS